MNRCVLLLIVSVLLGGLGTPALSSGASSMPEVLEIPPLPWPTWIQAEALESALASSERDLPWRLHPVTLRELEGLVMRPPSDDACIEIGDVFVNYINARVPDDLKSAVEGADFVLHGRITGRAPGFKGDIAGTLLRAERLAVIKGVPNASSYYFFIPVAEFTFAGSRLCKTDSRYVELPEVGDEVIVFSGDPLPAVTGELYLEATGPPDILLIRNQKTTYPRWYSQESVEDDTTPLPQDPRSLLEDLRASESSTHDAHPRKPSLQ